MNRKSKTKKDENGAWSKPVSARVDKEMLGRLQAVADHPKHRRKLGSLVKLMIEDQLPIFEAELGIGLKKK